MKNVAHMILGMALAANLVACPVGAQARGGDLGTIPAFGTCRKDGKGVVPRTLDETFREISRILSPAQLATFNAQLNKWPPP